MKLILAIAAVCGLLSACATTGPGGSGQTVSAARQKPRAPSAGFTLVLGHKITFEVAEGGLIRVLSDEVVDFSYVLPPADPRQLDKVSTAKPGQVIVSMGFDPDQGTLMKVESGLTFPFDYKAFVTVIERDGVTRDPSSVCTVRSGLTAWERWDEQIQKIDLNQFVRYDGPFHCPEPPEPMQGRTV